MKTDMDYIAEQCAEIDRRQGVKPTSSCMVDSVVGFSPVFWEHEDELPEMSDDDFGAIFPESRLTGGTIGVRVYPYVKDAHGNKIFISKPNAVNHHQEGVNHE